MDERVQATEFTMKATIESLESSLDLPREIEASESDDLLLHMKYFQNAVDDISAKAVSVSPVLEVHCLEFWSSV